MKKKFVIIIFILCLILGILTVCFGIGKNTIIRGRNYVLWKVFGVSGEEQVIFGRDGWLFYSETLDDYTGESALADEEISKICDVLQYIDSYCAEYGAEFCFIAAPDKNTVYPEMMPGRYTYNPSDNCRRISEASAERGLDVPDISALLKEHKGDSLLYHKNDTHWNNLGASYVVDYITERYSDILTDSYKLSGLTYEEKRDFPGDLTGLLLPGREVYDSQYYLDIRTSFRYTSYPDNMMDMIITAEKDAGGHIYMMRDSFANAIIPLLSDQAGECFYTRSAVFASVEKACESGADIVIFEIAERNLRNLLEWSV